MGFFDFLFKPRVNTKHHYLFAHRVLPAVAFRDPLRVIGCLTSGDTAKFLDLVLGFVDSALPAEPRRRFRGKHIRITTRAIHGEPCVILQMPPATTPPEAYFIAILGRLRSPDDDDFDEDSDEVEMEIDYYTLERTAFPSLEAPTVFGGWLPDGSHLNFGDGPAPTLKEFIAFLEEWLGGPRSVSARSHPPA